MKIKYLIIGFCLIGFAFNLYAQKTQSSGDYNGYEWKKFERIFKIGFVSGLLVACDHYRNDIDTWREFVLSPEYIKSYLKKKEITKSQSVLLQTFNELLIRELLILDYGGVTVGQFIEGLDDFYGDYRNMKIPIVAGMKIVKMSVEGKSQEEINTCIELYRKIYF